MQILLLLAFISVRLGSVGAESVDVIELNHYYDDKGRLVFDQVVFWARSATGKFQVRAWCMVDDNHVLNRRPVTNPANGITKVDWYDSDKKITRKITSRLYRESWSKVDPERNDKRFHPDEFRAALVHPIAGAPLGDSSPAGVPAGRF